MKILRQCILSLFRAYYCLFKKNIKIGPNVFIHPAATLVSGNGTITIGHNCQIHKGVIINTYGGNISIGNNVSINPYSIIYGHGDLTIGNDVRIAAQALIIPANHNFNDPDKLIRKQGLSQEGITIENDVWIGAGAKILDGVTVTEGCVIGAGAMVNKSTEPYGIYVGTPAKKIDSRKK
jgi:acetyltransferase-like isoleucine patch superfamily enzyme